MRCDYCDVDMIDVQTKMDFRALPAGEDWVQFPVLAGVCPKCGQIDLQVPFRHSLGDGWLAETARAV